MRTVLIAVALCLLTACGGGDVEAKAEPTEKALPKVSAATTCGQLLDGDAPLTKVVDLMSAEASTTDDEAAAELADELEPIGAQAGEELGPHVDVVTAELREYADTTAGETFDTSDMVTSLTELNNACGSTPRF